MEIRWIKCKTDNCYLVTEGGNAVLVDTGSSICYEKVIEECSRYNMRLIVLTHVHFDHAENAAKLAERFDIPVAYHQADEELLKAEANLDVVADLRG